MRAYMSEGETHLTRLQPRCSGRIQDPIPLIMPCAVYADGAVLKRSRCERMGSPYIRAMTSAKTDLRGSRALTMRGDHLRLCMATNGRYLPGSSSIFGRAYGTAMTYS